MSGGLASEAKRRLRGLFLKRTTIGGAEVRYAPWHADELLEVGRALLGEGRSAEAAAILGRAVARFPGEAWLATTYGEALNRERRWTEAVEEWRRQVVRFPDQVQAYGGLSTALEESGQADAADAVLCQAAPRFPQEYWLRVRHAQFADLRRDAEAAAARWTGVAADFPDELYPVIQRAVWLRAVGETRQGLDGLAAAHVGWPDDAYLLIVSLELAIDLGDTAQALSHWRRLRDGDRGPFGAALLHQSWRLFLALEGDEARREVADVLLAEPDAESPDWRPTVVIGAQSLTFDAFSDRARAAIRAAIAATPRRTLLHRMAWSAAGGAVGPFEASANLQSALERGDWAAQILLEDWSFPGRTDSYAGAVRELLPNLVSAELASPEPRYEAVLLALQAASVFDRASFQALSGHCAEHLTRRPVPERGGPADAVASIVTAHREPAAPRPVRSHRLKIALCVSGQLRGFREAFPSWRRLGLEAHDTTVFVHAWKRQGAKPPEYGHAHRSFEPAFADAFVQAMSQVGMEGLRRRYPRLFGRLDTREDAEVGEAELAAFYGAAEVRVEDESEPRFSGRPNTWKMLYKIREAHRLAVDSGVDFDLFIRLRPDRTVEHAGGIDWRALAEWSAAGRIVYADEGRHFHGLVGYFIGDQFAAGGRAAMDVYAGAFDFVADRTVFATPAEDVPHAGLAYRTLHGGVAVERAPGLVFGPLMNATRVASAEIEALMTADLEGRAADDLDRRLLEASGRATDTSGD